MPSVPEPPSRRAISGARFAIAITLIAYAAYLVDQIYRVVQNPLSIRVVIDTATYAIVVTLLTASALAYLVTRLGYLYRIQEHHRVPRASIDDYFTVAMPTLTAIIPSYKEDARVVRQTLLSTALQEYPFMRIVLLIDDPPNPTSPEEQAILEAARSLPLEIEELLRPLRTKFEHELDAFERHDSAADVDSEVDPIQQITHLADLYAEASNWFHEQALVNPIIDHTDLFLSNSVLGRLGTEMGEVATALNTAAAAETQLSPRRMLQLHRRLAWIFRAELSSFERKQYSSLSHEANKAMNLNSYIGLMGRRFKTQEMVGGTVLIEVTGEAADLEFPDPEYVLTLDADSTLLPEYCLRLVYLMEQQEFSDVAVSQTPYSAYPGANNRIERISGATTDLQHIVHQGLTRDSATFWVGANAVLRKQALDQICELDFENGLPIRRYVQDRTPIEDTESTIDICIQGWKLYNFPERLSYSATPPDFGSLCVQRQRWANGGLLVVPKFRELFRIRKSQIGLRAAREGFLRLNYLASIAWASFGLILLLIYPYNSQLVSPLAMLAAVPYFVAQSTDLRRCGYRRSDVLRVYGLNFLLLAVNTLGVLKSLEQSIGGQKIDFARTPKVRNRTAAPLTFVLVPYIIVIWSGYTLWHDIRNNHLSHAAFAAINMTLTAYALIAFVGLRNSLSDIRVSLAAHLYKPVKKNSVVEEPDWVSVLYYGSAETSRSSTVAPRVAALALVDLEPELLGDISEDPRTAHAINAANPEAQRSLTESAAADPSPVKRRRRFLRGSRSNSEGRSSDTNRLGWLSRTHKDEGQAAPAAEAAATAALIAQVGEYVKGSGGEFTVRFEDGKVEITVGKSGSLDQEDQADDDIVIDLSDGAVIPASGGSDKGSEPEESNRSPVAGN